MSLFENDISRKQKCENFYVSTALFTLSRFVLNNLGNIQ